MKVSYYTIDDIRLGYDPKGVTGWRLSQFLDYEDALKHYKELPASRVKAFGLTDGVHQLELVRCVKLFRYDREGECVLGSDYREFPLWRDVAQAKEATQSCIMKLKLRYMLTPDAVVPIPSPHGLPESLRDKYLWLNFDRDPDSAIRLVYIAGTGWVPHRAWKRDRDMRPLVLKYQADGLTETGVYAPLEIEPWEYQMLVCRTLERLNHNTQKKEE